MTSLNDEIEAQLADIFGAADPAPVKLEGLARLAELMDRIERIGEIITAMENVAGCMVVWQALLEDGYQRGRQSVLPKVNPSAAQERDRSHLKMMR